MGRKFAIIVPKKCGDAVTRNKIKRRVREQYRRLQHQLPGDLVSIWIAHPKTSEASYIQIGEQMKELYKKFRLLGEPA